MKTSGNILRSHGRRAMLALVSLAALTFGSCADDDVTSGTDGDKGANVSFNVSQAQDNAQAAAKGMPVTRASFTNELALQGLTPADLPSQKIEAQGMSGACLIETTTAGIDNNALHAPAAATRANIKGEGTNIFASSDHFATIGYRGTSEASVATISSKPWFHDADTKADGTIVSPTFWSWFRPWGKFFAVYPRHADYPKLNLSADSYTSTPYVDFEVDPDVKKQKDLMVACSGKVQYTTQGTAPTTNLSFIHTLTAVRFKVGQNLSWDKKISKIEIIGAKSKGRYTLPTDRLTPTNEFEKGSWSNLSTPATFTLDGLNVSTSVAVNNIIIGKNNDNYTFYMIPQTLSGVSIKVSFTDGSTPITASLTGEWKAGTTKVYALSQITSNWEYVLTIKSPTQPVDYDQTNSGYYYVTSYRKVGSKQEPVKWKIVGYQESTDGGDTWTALSDTRPAWLTALSLESGNGYYTSDNGTATLQKGILTDRLTPYNKVLHDAIPKGSPSSYYDLSEHDYKGNATARNTANSYLISSSGYYKIPLVYGNAIKNGIDNPHSYISNVPTASLSGDLKKYYFLPHFVDQNDVAIDNPWITQTHGGANAPDGAKIVWEDCKGIVEQSSLSLSSDGKFVQFHIPQNKIRNGNAVIAVTRGGKVMWSWHLWFAHDDELNTTAIENNQGVTYNFTKSPLGFVNRKWETTSYDKPRMVRVKIEQTIANNGIKQTGNIVISQKPGSVREFYSTYYSWGRKDAFPEKNAFDGIYYINLGYDMRFIHDGILHPDTYYRGGNLYIDTGDHFHCGYFNLWSIDNTVVNFTAAKNDNPVVKTIYDPCPAGFKVPAANAFSGFTIDGENQATTGRNIVGEYNYGWTFKSHSGNNTIYFPATGERWGSDLPQSGIDGAYYTASAIWNGSVGLTFASNWVMPRNYIQYISNGCAIRPATE